MKNLKKKGFTIVELVIVIAVIAVLAAVLIPTFSNLINKANMSADQIAVKNMNTILSTDEVSNGKPATVVEAQKVLKLNGVNNFTAFSVNNVYYWIGSENTVILWDSAESKVTYPENMAKKFKDVTSILKDWSRLDEYGYIEVNPTEDQTLEEALNSTIKDAKDGAYIKLPENSEANIGMYAYYWGKSYLKNADGTGKSLSIDLNGSTLISNETLVLNGTDYGYYGITIPKGGALTLINGNIDIKTDNSSSAALVVETDSTLVLKEITMKTNGSAIYPSGAASEVIVENSFIEGGTYALGTNNRYSNSIHICVLNSTLKAESCAMLVNVPSYITIDDSELIGGGWGLFVRSGFVEVNNTTIKTTDDDTGSNDSRYNTSCEYFAYNQSASDIPYWGQGAQAPYATLIVGDYSSHNSYNHDTTCNLNNVKLVSANSAKVPEIIVAARPEGKDVVLNYDNSSAVGRTLIYGQGYVRKDVDGTTIKHVFSHKGTIQINGEEANAKLLFTLDYGTFAAGSEQPVSILNEVYKTIEEKDYTETVKTQIETDWGIDLTEEEWATAKLNFSSSKGNNALKSIKYTSGDATITIGEAGTGENYRNRITLKAGSLVINTATDLNFVDIDFIEDAQEIKYIDIFEEQCNALGYDITDTTVLVIGDTANEIVGIK